MLRWVQVRTVPGGPEFERRSLLPANRWGNVYLHRITRSDCFALGLHDHSFDFVSVVLRGHYREVLANGAVLDRPAGSIGFRRAETEHAVRVVYGPVVTLVVRGPRRRRWGFRKSGRWSSAVDLGVE